MIFERMVFSDPWDVSAVILSLPPPQMIRGRFRDVEGRPAQQLRPPADIDILFVCKKVLVEIFLTDFHLFQHRSPKEDCGAADAEDMLQLVILAPVSLAVRAIDDPTVSENKVPGAVEEGVVGPGRLRGLRVT